MKRIGFAAGILFLIAVQAAVVLLASPCVPVVGPCMEIEEIWEIEDEREERGEPLITALENQGVPLAYDRESHTFYCTLGLQNGETWPKLRLTAPQADKKTKICFVDDYEYDFCNEAIAYGYSYELMAYDEEEYSYFSLVFTGLPLVCMTTTEIITDQDTPVYVTLSAYGEEAVRSNARAHLRGGVSRGAAKPAYRVEYTRYADGRKKVACQTPGLGLTDSLLLLAMPYDKTMMRDRLSWEIYGEMMQQTEGFPERATAYAELFIDDAYAGIYLMMRPFDIEEELRRQGESHTLTDSVYRTGVSYLSWGREFAAHPYREDAGYELFYAPEGSEPFAALETYIRVLKTQEDAEFLKLARRHVDTQSLLRMALLLQAGGMTDNIFNNLYIWAEQTPHGYLYHFVPWDMDLTWGLKTEDIGEQFENWMYFPLADRMLNLDQGLRERLWRLWTALREDALSVSRMEERLAGYARELNDSGAMVRNAERWGTENYSADGNEILEYALLRFSLLDETLKRLAASGQEGALFLDRTQYEGKGSAIAWNEEEMGDFSL